ncbi:Peroxidase 43 [Acorus calamus]|uniref:peroxidase n=1 Tax=Acorus calamus TaxID=4465 RepID=A0AAV9CHV9_ACOCL|nr:Peroxidase 43 [Acorus calamus]
MDLILSSLKVSNVSEVTQSKEGVAESKGNAKVVKEMMLVRVVDSKERDEEVEQQKYFQLKDTSGGPKYSVETGRRDGRSSDSSAAVNLPVADDSVSVLKNKFLEKGLSDKDLVLLTGAHTIGTTACFFVTGRLYDPSGPDPTINPTFLPELKSRCPKGGQNNVRLSLDHDSDQTFDTSLYSNIRDGFGVIKSDAVLYSDPSTRGIIDEYIASSTSMVGPVFEQDFAESMVRMGRLGEGSAGEIRRASLIYLSIAMYYDHLKQLSPETLK